MAAGEGPGEWRLRARWLSGEEPAIARRRRRAGIAPVSSSRAVRFTKCCPLWAHPGEGGVTLSVVRGPILQMIQLKLSQWKRCGSVGGFCFLEPVWYRAS